MAHFVQSGDVYAMALLHYLYTAAAQWLNLYRVEMFTLWRCFIICVPQQLIGSFCTE